MLAGREASEILQGALGKLSPELRETVILRDLQEMEYREIAQVLKIPEGTVKSRLNRGPGGTGAAAAQAEGSAMTCANFEIALCDYLDGTLAPAEKAEVEQHLSTCAACAELARDAGAAIAFMERVADVEPPPELVTRMFAIPGMPRGAGLGARGYPRLVPQSHAAHAAAAHGDGTVADDSVLRHDGALRRDSRAPTDRGGSRPGARVGGRGRSCAPRLGTHR